MSTVHVGEEPRLEDGDPHGGYIGFDQAKLKAELEAKITAELEAKLEARLTAKLTARFQAR